MSELRQRIEKAEKAIRAKTSTNPVIGIILGTGLGALANEIGNKVSIPYSELPGFVRPTVESHGGELIFGSLGGKSVVAMKGRFHYYEGYSPAEITFPVRVMKALGVKTLVVSNACGGMNPQWKPGDLMIIEDHINLMGINPLIGPNDNDLGLRFPDMCQPYGKELIALAEKLALREGIVARKGVYVAVTGPNLETRAEYRFLRTIGADVVGMSTIPEVIVAVHAGMKVLGISVITDSCLPDALKPARLEEILAIAGEAEPKLTKLISACIREM